MKNLLVTVLIVLILAKNELHSQKLSSSIIYTTYYGNSGTDDADVVAVDKDGNTYLGCHSNSTTLPGADRYPYTLSGGMDAFIVKLNNSGTEVAYLTQLGGAKWDAIQGIIADESGNIYAVGTTYSMDFPIDSNGFQSKFGGKSDAFVLKIDPKGAIIWSTFLGGKEDEDGRGITLDKNGNIHIIGRTASSNFPTTNGALQSKLAGGIDAFITTLDTNGNMLSSTYLGGSGDDIGFAIKVAKTGQLYAAGTSSSQDFPVKNALQAKNKGQEDAFLAVMDIEKSTIEFASYIGGQDSERLYSIDLDAAGDIFMMGFTSSSDYPTTQGAFQSEIGGVRDVFVTKINPKKRKLIYSTYLGGTKDDRPKNMVVNKGTAIVIGFTESNDFPTHNQTTTKVSGEIDAFITILNPNGSSLLYSNLFGGNGDDFFEGIALGKDGSITVSGGSNSTNITTKNELQNTFKGGRFDILVTRLMIK
jgi:hypothetical protein